MRSIKEALVGIKADGLLYLEKSSNTLKEYNRLWFCRSNGDKH
ncbi:MAG: hypothetical protein ACFFCS_24475 [Candidatus Hodarchaeota archaeon]